MEIIHFQYIQDAIDDGDVYVPRREINVTHDSEEHGTITEVVETFRQFLYALGYSEELVDKVQVHS